MKKSLSNKKLNLRFHSMVPNRKKMLQTKDTMATSSKKKSNSKDEDEGIIIENVIFESVTRSECKA